MKFMGIGFSVLGALLFLLGFFGGKNGDWLFGFIILSIGVMLYIKGANKQKLKERGKFISELPELKSADYSHVYAGTAIALNKSSQTLFLADGVAQKNYPFADVRKWNYEVLTGGGVVGTGLQAAGHNRRVNQANREGSGFFVEVRDIDHPKWHIRFEYDRKIETELLRWMEILRQHINEK